VSKPTKGKNNKYLEGVSKYLGKVEKEKFVAEMQKRKDSNQVFKYREGAFDKQIEVIEDKSRLKVACTTRRAGKTMMCVYYLIKKALEEPRGDIAYVSIDKGYAVKNVWKDLSWVLEDHGIKAKLDANKYTITFPNGATIHICGAKDQKEVSKLRGYALRFCIVDECQSIRDDLLQELLRESVLPALSDHMGTLLLTGTPGRVKAGLFWDAVNNRGNFKKAKQFFWTAADNKKYPAVLKGLIKPEQVLEYIREELGYEEDDPAYIREYLGKWVDDSGELLYPIDDSSFVSDVPNEMDNVQYILGIDTGWHDNDAYVVWAYSNKWPTTYVVETVSMNHCDVTTVADTVKTLNSVYHFTKIVIDPASGGRKMAEEITKRHGVKVDAAEKFSPKANGVHLLSDDIRRERVKFVEDKCKVLIAEARMAHWVKKADNTLVPSDKDDHCLDAMLYGFAQLRHFWAKPDKKPAKVGSPEYYDEIVERDMEKAIEASKKIVKEREDDKYNKILQKANRSSIANRMITNRYRR